MLHASHLSEPTFGFAEFRWASTGILGKHAFLARKQSFEAILPTATQKAQKARQEFKVKGLFDQDGAYHQYVFRSRSFFAQNSFIVFAFVVHLGFAPCVATLAPCVATLASFWL